MIDEALEHLVKGIVDNPEEVVITERDGRRGTTLEVRVHPDDIGKVIGRNGRTAKALRTVVSALAGRSVRVDLIEAGEARQLLLVVGRIGRAHGLRGEVTIEVRTDNPEERFAVGNVLTTEPSNLGPLTIETVRNHNGTYLLSFSGKLDRSQAEMLRNATLLTEVNVKSSHEVEDSFHISEIVGLTVKNLEGTTIGKVVDVMELPVQDTLVIEISNGSELLLPFVKKHVPEVNLDSSELVIDNYEGLL